MVIDLCGIFDDVSGESCADACVSVPCNGCLTGTSCGSRSLAKGSLQTARKTARSGCATMKLCMKQLLQSRWGMCLTEAVLAWYYSCQFASFSVQLCKLNWAQSGHTGFHVTSTLCFWWEHFFCCKPILCSSFGMAPHISCLSVHMRHTQHKVQEDTLQLTLWRQCVPIKQTNFELSSKKNSTFSFITETTCIITLFADGGGH